MSGQKMPFLVWTLTVWNQLFHHSPVSFINKIRLSKPPLPLGRLLGHDMACIRLGTDYFSCSRYLEALCSTSVCLHLWHFYSPVSIAQLKVVIKRCLSNNDSRVFKRDLPASYFGAKTRIMLRPSSFDSCSTMARSDDSETTRSRRAIPSSL